MKLFFILIAFYSCTTPVINTSQEKRPTQADSLAFQSLSYTSDLTKLQNTVAAQAILISNLQKSQKKDSTNILSLNKSVKSLQDTVKFYKVIAGPDFSWPNGVFSISTFGVARIKTEVKKP